MILHIPRPRPHGGVRRAGALRAIMAASVRFGRGHARGKGLRRPNSSSRVRKVFMSNYPDGNGRGVVPGNVGDGFMVVGLGASAGGIRALGEFFEHVPEGSGMAYVVILHLSPEHDSRLAEVLQKSTRMPVTQVNESVRVEP